MSTLELSVLLRGRLDLLQFLGRRLLEQRVLDHLLVEQFRQFERRHRQQLDRLLQRRRQNQLLNEFGVEFLRDCHASAAQFPPAAKGFRHPLSRVENRRQDRSASRPRQMPARREYRF
jgi:hypothetical protein